MWWYCPAWGRGFGRFVLSVIIVNVVICLNPFNPKSDQYLFYPNNVTTFSREKLIRIYEIITKEEILVSKRVSKEYCRVFPLRPIFRPVVIFKSTHYYFIINWTACTTCFAGVQKWTPWTVEWGGRNCERGLQGHSRLDPAKATLNCFRPRAHESRLIFETAELFTRIRVDEDLNHSRERFQKDIRLT